MTTPTLRPTDARLRANRKPRTTQTEAERKAVAAAYAPQLVAVAVEVGRQNTAAVRKNIAFVSTALHLQAALVGLSERTAWGLAGAMFTTPRRTWFG